MIILRFFTFYKQFFKDKIGWFDINILKTWYLLPFMKFFNINSRLFLKFWLAVLFSYKVFIISHKAGLRLIADN